MLAPSHVHVQSPSAYRAPLYVLLGLHSVVKFVPLHWGSKCDIFAAKAALAYITRSWSMDRARVLRNTLAAYVARDVVWHNSGTPTSPEHVLFPVSVSQRHSQSPNSGSETS